MASSNPFDLLGDDDAEDPSLLIAKVAATTAVTKKATQAKQPPPSAQSQPAKLPSKPLPPTQAVKEARSESVRGGGRGGGRGYGRGRGGYKREESSFGNTGASAGLGAPEEGDGGKSSERRGYGGSRGGYRGGRRGGFANGDVDDDEGRPRRAFERRSGTGRGNELKREGSGRGNWGTPTDELAEVTEEVVKDTEKNVTDEKPVGEEEAADGNKENPGNEPEEKEPEEKEMTLEEYEKLLEEKRKTLQTHKTEERKVDAKQFESMQPLSNKKGNDDDIFIKLGSDKDKKKEAFEKDEKSKKSVSINEFLKPAEGEKFYNTGGRGRGRGRGSRGYGIGGRDGMSNVPAPSIEDPSHFPTLGGK